MHSANKTNNLTVYHVGDLATHAKIISSDTIFKYIIDGKYPKDKKRQGNLKTGIVMLLVAM